MPLLLDEMTRSRRSRADSAPRRRDSTSNCRFNQSFNGSTMAGDFFGAPGAAGAADAGGAVVIASELICGLAAVGAPGAVAALFGSAIGRAFAAGLASSSGLREASAAGRGRG